MTTGLIITIAAVWIGLSAIILVSICMLSSRLSQREELREGLQVRDITPLPAEGRAQSASQARQSRNEMVESPAR